ncbi:MAG: hypothetical protein ABJB34_02365 [Acidobacteriota bacterium]
MKNSLCDDFHKPIASNSCQNTAAYDQTQNGNVFLTTMRSKITPSIFLSAMLVFICTGIAGAQGNTSLSKACSDRSSMTTVALQKAGDVFYAPCPGRSNIFDKNVSFRKNNTDPYLYGFSFDSLSNYDGLGESTNFYSEFNIDNLVLPNRAYLNSNVFLNLSTNLNFSSAVASASHVIKTGSGDVHDINSFLGETIVTAGRVTSGIYGLSGAVGVFGGGTHGDIADLRVGGSTVSNTTARSYSGIWITRPTMTNATFTGPVTALRIDDGPRTPAFTISETGQIRIVHPTTPVNAAAPCQAGEIVWDQDYVYVCVSTDSWKRTMLAAW